MRVQSVMMIRVLNQTAQTAMRTQMIMMLMQQQMVRHLAMALARILMMTLAFLLLARLELVAAGVESVGHGVGKGKARRVHAVHVLQSLTLLRLQSKSKVHRG